MKECMFGMEKNLQEIHFRGLHFMKNMLVYFCVKGKRYEYTKRTKKNL